MVPSSFPLTFPLNPRASLGKAAFGLNQVLKNFRSELDRILIQDDKEFYFYKEEIPCYDSDQGLIQTESKLPYVVHRVVRYYRKHVTITETTY